MKKTGKFKSGFVTAAKEEQRKEAEQERLRDKHNVQEDNVLIVEKDNMGKFLIRCIARLIQVIATLIVLALATVGVLTIIYPSVRGELIWVLLEIFEDLQTMLPFF